MSFPLPPTPSSQSQQPQSSQPDTFDEDDPSISLPRSPSLFPPDPFSEPSPPHQHHPSPFHPDPTSSQEIKPASSEPPPDLPPQSGPSLLQLGTVIVIGAMAANVIGFRYSRWAVGKDIHRAWENQQRRQASQRGSQQTARNTRRRAAEAEARRREMEQQRIRAEEQKRRREFDRRLKEEQERRDDTRRSYARWERVFGGGIGGFRVDVDQRVVEELLRGLRRNGGMQEQILKEFLRGSVRGNAKRKERDDRDEFAEIFRMFEEMAKRRGGGADDFQSFQFWERVQGNEWRGGFREAGMGGGTEGVFGRGDTARHYSILGLQKGASDQEIKTAYRREVMKWHPDRYRGNDPELAARKFREVTDAYNALTKN